MFTHSLKERDTMYTTSERGYAWPAEVATLARVMAVHAAPGPNFNRAIRDELASLMRAWDADDARVWCTSARRIAAHNNLSHLIPLADDAIASVTSDD